MSPAALPGLPGATLPALLALLPNGIVYYTPVLDGAGEVVDFQFAYLNAAAQRLLRLPAQPTATYLQQWPGSVASGAFAFHRDTFRAGAPAQLDQFYQADGYDVLIRAHATRLDEGLLVSFTDGSDQPRPAVEVALRESQAREQKAYAEVAAQRATLQATLEQAPVAIALLDGPAHVITFANASMARIWGRPVDQLLGRAHFEALPDLAGQGFEDIFAAVYRTGQPHHLREQLVQVNREGTGELIPGYFNIVYQPLRTAQGEITGIIASATEVTEQVRGRQQVQRLNQELETLVLARTQALRHAYAATEQEREQLYQVFEQTPVAIAIMRGPNLRVELANPAVAAIWGREPAQVLGRPYFEVLPETVGQGFEQVLAGVLATGQAVTLTDAPVTLARAHTGRPAQAYVSFTFQPLRDAEGAVTGLVASGVEATEQVLARQQVQRLNQALTASNGALEARVQARTHEAQEARQQAERQRNELQRVFEQAPVGIAIFRGPDNVIELANAAVCALWGRTPAQALGTPLLALLPEVAGQGFDELLAQVRATGQPFEAFAMPSTIYRRGRLDDVYWDFVYLPNHEADGTVTGVMVVANEVTAQVEARQQLEQLNRGLEERVRERTQQLEAQQGLLRQILRQVPAAVATLGGPEHRFTFFNDQYQDLVLGRALLGAPVAAQLPEVVEQGFIALLDQVYASGEAFVGRDIAIQLREPQTDLVTQRYLDFVYQPLADAQGQAQGILAFVVDTTEKVLARRQAETLQAAALAAVQRRAQQRQELYQIFAQAPVAIVLLREPDHRIEYFNPAFEVLFPPEEWTGGDLHGHTLAAVYPRIKLIGLMQLIDRVFETGEPQAVLDMPLADLQPGSPRYVTLSYQPYRAQGRIVGVAAFAYDVTEQVLGRRAAEAMQAELLAGAQRSAQERQELLALFERAPVAVALLREPDHRIEYFNTAFAELYPGEDLLGRPVATAYPGMASPDVIGRLDQVYATGETYRGQEEPLRTATPGGPPRYVTFTYQAYREHERIAGVAVFIHEVTEQVLARRAREAQQQLVEAVFEQSPTALFVLRGPRYTIELVNPLMEQMLGRARAELLGRPYFEAMPELAAQGYADFMDEVWRTGQAVVVQEQPAHLSYHRAGETGYFTFVYQPLRAEPRGPVTGIACVAVDVTAQVQARQQVQHLNDQLAAINEEVQATNEELHDTNARLTRTNTDLDTFVYTASHDLKAPIANIEGLLLALREQLPPAALQANLVPRLFDMMEGSVARFQQTIGHLTDISQLQRAEAPETLDLPALIDGVRLDLAPLLEAAPAVLTVAVAGCQAVRVAPKTLRSVVYNLLSNAVKYRAPDRPAQVQLRAHCTPGRLVLAVQDNGLGLTTAQQGQLFGMFRRLHVHVEGSGVGLFMVKRLVENAGGTITVESQPGVGSTFTVSLPA